MSAPKCEHGNRLGRCDDCECADLRAELAAQGALCNSQALEIASLYSVAAERDALKAELEGASENMVSVLRERDALQAQVERMKSDGSLAGRLWEADEQIRSLRAELADSITMRKGLAAALGMANAGLEHRRALAKENEMLKRFRGTDLLERSQRIREKLVQKIHYMHACIAAERSEADRFANLAGERLGRMEELEREKASSLASAVNKYLTADVLKSDRARIRALESALRPFLVGAKRGAYEMHTVTVNAVQRDDALSALGEGDDA